ncbi:LysR family transcriptional regulator [Herbaspirillum sp. 3R11]|uniref:LysR family transcriptional regulator n=1 Tax=unclassified Herbaspirillum TaxID=2624150 RepID=UPI0032AF0484
MTPDLYELDAFAAVARHRSFRKAAAERGITASAMSHAMRTLEDRLGARLLNRTTRSVTLTEAGEMLLRRLSPALQEVAEALTDLAAMQEQTSGTLRLNMPRPAARLAVGPILARFISAHPRVQIEIVTDDGLSDIVSAGFDAGIRFGERLAGDMIALPIGPPQAFVMVASPSYLAQHGAPQKPADLLSHACIGRRFPSGTRYAWELSDKGRPLTLSVNGALVLDDDVLMIQAARDGLGIAYVYATMAGDELARGDLVAALPAWNAPASRFFYTIQDDVISRRRCGHL